MDRTKLYELAARNFWNSTQEKSTVSYLDVLLVAYEKAESPFDAGSFISTTTVFLRRL